MIVFDREKKLGKRVIKIRLNNLLDSISKQEKN